MLTLAISKLPISTIMDVRCAYDSRSGGITERSDWMDFVDPETMDEVKAIYKDEAKKDGTLSFSRVVNAIAKYSLTRNIKF